MQAGSEEAAPPMVWVSIVLRCSCTSCMGCAGFCSLPSTRTLHARFGSAICQCTCLSPKLHCSCRLPVHLTTMHSPTTINNTKI